MDTKDITHRTITRVVFNLTIFWDKNAQQTCQTYLPPGVLEHHKIPKIRASMCKPPKLVTEKNPPLNRPPNIRPAPPRGRRQGQGLYLEIALEYKAKQSKNGKFPSSHKASPIDLPNISPSKRTLTNISPTAYFRNFTVLYVSQVFKLYHTIHVTVCVPKQTIGYI